MLKNVHRQRNYLCHSFTWTCLGLAALAAFLLSACSSKPNYLKNRHWDSRLAEFDAEDSRKVDVVMLGNSITQGGNWSKLLADVKVANRGVAGDISEGLLQRMDYVYKLQPKMCFVMIGINDLGARIPEDTIFSNIAKVLDGLKKKNIKPVMQSILFTGPSKQGYVKRNAEVARLNARIKNYVAAKNIDYLDLNTTFAPHGALNMAISEDGVHINEPAYRLWAIEIQKHINRGMSLREPPESPSQDLDVDSSLEE